MSIMDFKAHLTQGGARANQFRVFLHFPAALGLDGAQIAGERGIFLCEAASLPGQTINVTPMMYRGREVKLSGERRYDNWMVTVINDGDFAIHNVFERWMNAINNLRDNTGKTDPSQYVSDMNVQQLDRNEKINPGALKTYTFKNTWPTSISPIQLNFSDNDNVERFQVEFAYDWFESSKVPL